MPGRGQVRQGRDHSLQLLDGVRGPATGEQRQGQAPAQQRRVSPGRLEPAAPLPHRLLQTAFAGQAGQLQRVGRAAGLAASSCQARGDDPQQRGSGAVHTLAGQERLGGLELRVRLGPRCSLQLADPAEDVQQQQKEGGGGEHEQQHQQPARASVRNGNHAARVAAPRRKDKLPVLPGSPTMAASRSELELVRAGTGSCGGSFWSERPYAGAR